MRQKALLFYAIAGLLTLFSPQFLFARNAPVTTAGSSTICPGSPVTVPITVTGFTSIKAITLRLDYDPTLLTFVNYTNLNPSISGTSVNYINVSPTLTKIMIVWADIAALSLSDGSKLLDLNFTLIAGSPSVIFNNTDNSGGDCEYADENGASMNDIPTATYYFNAAITNLTPPPAGAITGANTLCVGTTNVPYSVPVIANATAYIWTVPVGGSIISGSNTNSITVNYSNSAVSGNITVKGTNSCGQGVPSILAVTINPLPVPAISGPVSVCSGSPGNVYTTEQGMTGYVWIVSGGGSITSGGGTTNNTATITWNVTTLQSVSVNYTNPAGCSAQNPTVLPVAVNPLPSPTITGQAVVCESATGVSYTTEPGMINYLWTTSSGGTITSGSGTNNILVSWMSAGIQSVNVNYTSGNGCTANAPVSKNVTVNPFPGAAGTITGNASVCAGDNGISYATPAISNASTYTWTLPAGANIVNGAGTNNITVNFSTSAVAGNITVVGNNSCGNGTSSPAFPVTISQMPVAAGTITGTDVVCAGTNGVIYSVPAITNATTYDWTIPSGAVITSGAGTSQIVVSFSSTPGTGTFTVKGTSVCGSGAVSPDFSVTMVASQAAPVVTTAGPLLTSSTLTGNQWYYEGTGAISGATGQTYLATITGWYWTVVQGTGCPWLESNHVYVLFTGQDEMKSQNILLYPVPGDGLFTVSITSPEPEKFTILVYNQLGIKIFERNDLLVTGTIEQTIDIRPVTAGIYSVVFMCSDGTVVKKVLVR
jgi:hypothetical protein